MSAIQIKRGTTAEWGKGPELIDFSKCKVNGKDSTLYCKGTTFRMHINTTSAEVFTDADSTIISNAPDGKHYGLRIFGYEGDTNIYHPSCTHELNISLSTISTSDTRVIVCWGGQTRATLTQSNRSAKLTIPSGTYKLNVIALWDSVVASSSNTLELTMSIRRIGNSTYPAAEQLLPGQLGAEYLSDGGTALKVGPKAANNASTDWSAIPYIGQVLPSAMYGSEADRDSISAPVPGQLFFVKVT